MEYYRDFPCDVFANVSMTEGGAPVAIQEAVACGIPVVATNVGGNPEIVSEKNGIILDPDPSPEEIASALLKILDHPSMSAEMRKQSRLVWQARYNAEVNFRAFADKLRFIREK
jgi:glycosyltransferase involved in cell wall biosynthesis